MTIAIYNRPGSFSDRWIERCAALELKVREVDMFQTDLFALLRSANAQALLMHPLMGDRRTQLAAQAIVASGESSGIRLFPTKHDFWHFDDKLSQKYLLEASGIPSPTSYVFYDKAEALRWADVASFPKVFKLRAGAGAVNVELVRTRHRARWLIGRMFGRGFHATNAAVRDIRTKIRSHNKQRDWFGVIRRAPDTLRTLYRDRNEIAAERGYIYFQDFIPGNAYDTRITVIGDRAFGFRRRVRPNDFRASGSGDIDYDPTAIDLRAVALAFNAARRLRTTCMAFDFVEDPDMKEPLIIEMSFAFKPEAVFQCPGHWNSEMNWQSGRLWPQDAILNDLLLGYSR